MYVTNPILSFYASQIQVQKILQKIPEKNSDKFSVFLCMKLSSEISKDIRNIYKIIQYFYN